MNETLNAISQWIIQLSDIVCGVPEFLLLIGGGLFLFIYSGAMPVRGLKRAFRALAQKQADDQGKDTGQISSVQALLSAIAATVGMGNIAGVAIALAVGGPGVIFWMWVSALVGMATKFFEGTLSIMYKGRDSAGQVQGGPMYIITEGMGPRWRWLAVAFSIFGLVGTLCFMQANQLVESVTTVFTTPMGIENTVWLRFTMGVVMMVVVGAVVLGGIKRIAAWASKLVPIMVMLYFLLVVAVVVLHYKALPAAFASIFEHAFDLRAGFGAFTFVALTGARRAAMVNEAGVGTASMMHGASKNTDAVKEGLIAMLAPAIDSGLICTFTAIPILLAGQYAGLADVKGLYIALNSFGALLPGVGQYLLMAIVFCFAFSTMFSYGYYGLKCAGFLFGAHRAKYYNYYYLVMLVVAAVMPLDTLVSVMDLAFALMALCTMIALVKLSPRAKALAREYFSRPATGKN